MPRARYTTKKTAKALGLKIRQMRTERRWTLEFCEEKGFPNWTHLRRIEAGKPSNLATLANLANLFGVSLSELFDGI